MSLIGVTINIKLKIFSFFFCKRLHWGNSIIKCFLRCSCWFLYIFPNFRYRWSHSKSIITYLSWDTINRSASENSDKIWPFRSTKGPTIASDTNFWRPGVSGRLRLCLIFRDISYNKKKWYLRIASTKAPKNIRSDRESSRIKRWDCKKKAVTFAGSRYQIFEEFIFVPSLSVFCNNFCERVAVHKSMNAKDYICWYFFNQNDPFFGKLTLRT